MIKFECHLAKANSNIKKHGISFEEARSVFYDEFACLFYDDSHTQLEEDRFLMLGTSNESRLLLCHCERNDRNFIRIISASKATKLEKRHY
ncbi:BrnT family toxin [Alteromonas sp. ASW11-130]|uniref:BrnT family toxin n=1 Tax=Alteromonas sp. ASW11-130 TaxID=3015775 RepID=UPI003FA42CBA